MSSIPENLLWGHCGEVFFTGDAITRRVSKSKSRKRSRHVISGASPYVDGWSTTSIRVEIDPRISRLENSLGSRAAAIVAKVSERGPLVTTFTGGAKAFLTRAADPGLGLPSSRFCPSQRTMAVNCATSSPSGLYPWCLAALRIAGRRFGTLSPKNKGSRQALAGHDLHHSRRRRLWSTYHRPIVKP